MKWYKMQGYLFNKGCLKNRVLILKDNYRTNSYFIIRSCTFIPYKICGKIKNKKNRTLKVLISYFINLFPQKLLFHPQMTPETNFSKEMTLKSLAGSHLLLQIFLSCSWLENHLMNSFFINR